MNAISIFLADLISQPGTADTEQGNREIGQLSQGSLDQTGSLALIVFLILPS